MEELDPLAAALKEAESLMESLGGDDDAAGVDHFAIDSDEEDDGDFLGLNAHTTSSNHSTTTPQQQGGVVMRNKNDPITAAATTSNQQLHPLHEDFLSNNTAAAVAPSGPQSASFYPQQPQQQQQHSPFPVQQQQQQSQTPMPFSTGGAMSSLMMMGGGGTQPHPSSSPTAPSMDVFKASTSRFASNLATMAQRAANQVQTAVQAQPLTSHMHLSMSMPMESPFEQQQPLMQTTTTSATAASPNANTKNNMVPELDAEAQQTLLKTHVGDLIPGERVIMFLTNLRHVSDSTGFQSNDGTVWCCAMTYYRILLFATHPLAPPPAVSDWNTAAWPSSPPPSVLQLPLAALDRVEQSVFAVQSPAALAATSNHSSNSTNNNSLSQQILQQPQQYLGVVLTSKLTYGYQLRLATAHGNDAARAAEALQNYAFPGRRNLGYLFAFESKREAVLASVVVVDETTGQKTVTLEPFRRRYDAVKEFERQCGENNNNCPWSLWTSTNASYQTCANYPSAVAGPASLDERVHPDAARVVKQCAAFRSERRWPALTWTARAGGGSLWRCAQPKIGLQGNRSSADELFLRHIAEAAAAARSAAPPPALSLAVVQQLTGAASTADVYSNWMPQPAIQLKILDLRPRSAAMANRTGGYGYENTSNYPGCSLQFCNIVNIHGVRDSYQKLAALCLNPGTSDLTFRSAVEDTKWLSHIRLIWAAAWESAFWVHVHRTPVLIHCSHGWDRTSQVAALAQLLLDAHYRTRAGFASLCEKEFMSFGHPFHTRCGHGEGTSSGGGGGGGINNNSSTLAAASSTLDEGQISPIFLQFLDCVYQVVHQYPECFEFNTKYVLVLSEHIYSCRFGNFLCDTERERELVAGIRQRTHSVWDYLEERPDLVANNSHFDPSNSGGGGGVLLMPLPTLLRNITLWTDRHCAQGPKPTLRWLGNSTDDNVNELPKSDNKFRMDQPGGDILTEQEVRQRVLLLCTSSCGTSLHGETNEPSTTMTVNGAHEANDDTLEKPLIESQSSQVSSSKDEDTTSSEQNNTPLSEPSTDIL